MARGERADPGAIKNVAGLEANLRLQDKVAQKLNALRHIQGALDLETIEARPVFEDGEIIELRAEKKKTELKELSKTS